MTELTSVPPKDFDAVSYIFEAQWDAIRLGLERIEALLEALGNPQNELRFVHIAGTNGKGSTGACLQTVLQKAGYKTGFYTSPHLARFSERMRINGEEISDEDLARITWRVKAAVEGLDEAPTCFEIITAIGLCYFAEQACDIVVLEVGLGGRIDATNIIPAPELAVVVGIDLDHTHILGNSIEGIAHEKAGIIKPGCSVVMGQQKPEVAAIVAEHAHRAAAPLYAFDADKLQVSHMAQEDALYTEFTYEGFPTVRIHLLGEYQPLNASCALLSVAALRDKGWEISDEALLAGLSEARWPGRFELIGTDPAVILDGGHNPQGARSLSESLKAVFPGKRVVFVMGVLEDKDYAVMLEELVPLASHVVCITPPHSDRALSADKLARAVRWTMQDMVGCSRCVRAHTAEDMASALDLACGLKEDGELIVVCGSLYLIAPAKEAYEAWDVSAL